MEPIFIIIIVILFMILFIPNNNKEPFIVKIFKYSVDSKGEYSEMYDYTYGTNSYISLKYLDENKTIKNVKTLDYDKLYKVILKKEYHIDPIELNKALDWIDKNENITKIGKNFRINKLFKISSKDKKIQKIIDKLSQTEIDIIAEAAICIQESIACKRNILEASASSYFCSIVKNHIDSDILKKYLYFNLEISGIMQQYRLYNNPKILQSYTVSILNCYK